MFLFIDWDVVKEDGLVVEFIFIMKFKCWVILEKFGKEIEEMYNV